MPKKTITSLEAEIKQLETRNKELLRLLKENNDAYNALLETVDNDFEASPEYKDMKKQIEIARIEIDGLKKKAERRNEEKQKLQERVAQLEVDLKAVQEVPPTPAEQVHNARGAGRKPRIDAARVLKLHEQGLNQRQIASEIRCSVGSVNRLLKKLQNHN